MQGENQNKLLSRMDLERLKFTLLESFRESAKECESKFGGRTLLATENDPCVAKTIQLLERITQNGLKPKSLIPAFKNLSLNVNNFSFRQMSEIVSNGISLVMGPNYTGEQALFWHFVRNHLTKHEQERYYHLHSISTDYARGRAWLRSSLNEHSLDRYFRIFFSDDFMLKAYYEPWSFMCDLDMQSALIDIAKSLRSVIFALVVDRKDLELVDSSRNVLACPAEVEASPVRSKSPEAEITKPARKSKPRIVEFENAVPVSKPTLQLESSPSLTMICSSPSTRSAASFHSIGESEASSALATTSSVESLDVDEKKSTTLHPGELKQLLIQLTDRKAGLEREIDDYKEKYKKASQQQDILESELRQQKDNYRKLYDQHTELAQENTILKEQLKNYVSAVQMLGRNSDPTASLQAGPMIQASIPNDYYQEAIHFEEKLVQVAEMHGELIEFNSNLQRKLQVYEGLAARYRAELINLRGPFPSDYEDVGAFEGTSQGEEAAFLVHIWIPSTFLVKGSKETYHVYQVYLRIRDDEWNIYRRYSQFHALRKKFKKTYEEISSFDFPPKRSFGQRDACVVEDRRTRLQSFLRAFVNLYLSKQTPVLCPLTKETLVDAIPFFKED